MDYIVLCMMMSTDYYKVFEVYSIYSVVFACMEMVLSVRCGGRCFTPSPPPPPPLVVPVPL